MDAAAERELIRRCRDGSDAAFRQLIDEYQTLVFALIRRTGADPASAESLAQEVFLRVHRGLPYFQGQARLATWIYRIVESVCAARGDSPTPSLDAAGEEQRRIDEAIASAGDVTIPARFTQGVLNRRRRDWLQAEQRIDWWFNSVLAAAGVLVLLAVLFAAQRTGLVAVFADVAALVAAAIGTAAGRAFLFGR
jgi:hypothetical protein